jgi:GNAT superfamily N-acetyltransferase
METPQEMNQQTKKWEWRGYHPGVIGKIIELHAVYYHTFWGFDVSFETQEGRELCEFMSRFDPMNDGLWAVYGDGRFAGAVAIDGALRETDGARLRWLIVAPDFQGLGIGQALVRKAVEFSRSAGHHKIFLWTFQGLNAARHVYESEGFALVQEYPIEQWGSTIREQKFELIL